MNNTFQTTPEQQIKLVHILAEMVGFITKCAELARDDQGVYDLMELWFECKDPRDRGEILGDLQKIIDENEVIQSRITELKRRNEIGDFTPPTLDDDDDPPPLF